jgi:hypothetical protein
VDYEDRPVRRYLLPSTIKWLHATTPRLACSHFHSFSQETPLCLRGTKKGRLGGADWYCPSHWQRRQSARLDYAFLQPLYKISPCYLKSCLRLTRQMREYRDLPDGGVFRPTLTSDRPARMSSGVFVHACTRAMLRAPYTMVELAPSSMSAVVSFVEI